MGSRVSAARSDFNLPRTSFSSSLAKYLAQFNGQRVHPGNCSPRHRYLFRRAHQPVAIGPRTGISMFIRPRPTSVSARAPATNCMKAPRLRITSRGRYGWNDPTFLGLSTILSTIDLIVTLRRRVSDGCLRTIYTIDTSMSPAH